MDLRSDGRMELLEWLRWKEMKADKGYTKSTLRIQGATLPREDRYLVAGLSSMLDTKQAGVTDSSKTNLRLYKTGSCYVHL